MTIRFAVVSQLIKQTLPLHDPNNVIHQLVMTIRFAVVSQLIKQKE